MAGGLASGLAQVLAPERVLLSALAPGLVLASAQVLAPGLASVLALGRGWELERSERAGG